MDSAAAQTMRIYRALFPPGRAAMISWGRKRLSDFFRARVIKLKLTSRPLSAVDVVKLFS